MAPEGQNFHTAPNLDRRNNILSFGPSGVRALPLAAGINEGGHYFRYFSTFLVVVVTTAIQNHRRGCRRVPKSCMGS